MTGTDQKQAPAQARRRSRARRSERGGQISVFVLLFVGVLIILIGFVVDSSGQVTAAQDAENAAATAARFGSEAAATQELAGNTDIGPVAGTAARGYLNAAGVSGDVHVADGQVVVDTTITRSTKLLAIIGIATVTGHGHATSDLKNR